MTHPAFEIVREQYIETLNIKVQHFTHQLTGAEHYHFKADNDENVFLVACRTMPEDSTGVAHILEHTTLCGSMRFPVRDPFFLMLRRSLNTFMNAFTGSDYTAYPFATRNRKDFFNLMDVYLDAVFFPRLDPLDFAQEGHRLEFKDPEDASTELVYRGVVLNEMKGDSSSPISRLHTTLQKYLYPTTTYHNNSGGDPKVIPLLQYEDLLRFHRSHYHPGNAVFMTFGNIPVDKLHACFENHALSRFSKSGLSVQAGKEKRFSSPLRVNSQYPVQETDSEKKAHIVMAWLLEEIIDPEKLLKSYLLADVLLATSASPLRRALEESDLGDAVSSLSGIEGSNREMSFICGLEGIDESNAGLLEDLVARTLNSILNEGVDEEHLESALHQLELSQREIGGDGSPYGLQLMFSCLASAIHQGNPLDLLDLDPILKKLRSEIKKPHFFQHLVRLLLIENKHRITLVMAPDMELDDREANQEKMILRDIKNQLDSDQTTQLIRNARQLEERQHQPEDLSVLPSVGLDDIGPPGPPPEGIVKYLPGNRSLTCYVKGTNGIIYQQIITTFPGLSAEQCTLMPLYTSLLSEIGSADRGHHDTQLLQYANTGGVNAFSSIHTDCENTDSFRAYYTVSSKALAGKDRRMFKLLQETWQQPNFSELLRVRDLIKQIRLRRDHGITANGHSLAMTAASAPFRPVSYLSHELSGLGGLLRFRALDDALDNAGAMQSLIEELTALHVYLMTGKSQLLLIADSSTMELSRKDLESLWTVPGEVNTGSFEINRQYAIQDLAFTTGTQVNFCAQAFPTVPEAHADSPVLSVLAGVLRNGFLHPVIREQGGAYGGGAGHDIKNGIFRFFSYRDPNLMETFTAFNNAITWVIREGLDHSLVEEAILGIIGSLDSPASPAGEARRHFHDTLSGRSPEVRNQFRNRVLSTTARDVVRVAETWLTGKGCRAVITNPGRQSELDNGFQTIVL